MTRDRGGDQNTGSRFRAILFFAAKAGITIGALAWILYQVNVAHVIGSFRSINVTWLLIGVVALIAHFIIMVWRWGFVLQRLCGVHIPLRRLTYVFGLGEVLGTFFPSFIGIDAIRTIALGEAAPMRKVLESVIVDRVLGLVALLLLISISLPAFWANFGAGSIFYLLLMISLGGLLIFYALLCWPLRLEKLPVVGIRLLPVMEYLRTASTSHMLGGTIFGSGIVMHVLAVLIFWSSTRMLALELPFTDCLLIAPGALLIAALPISLGGWGVREGALVAGFALVGADPAAVTAASICYGLSGLVSGVLGVALSGFLNSLDHPTKIPH